MKYKDNKINHLNVHGIDQISHFSSYTYKRILYLQFLYQDISYDFRILLESGFFLYRYLQFLYQAIS